MRNWYVFSTLLVLVMTTGCISHYGTEENDPVRCTSSADCPPDESCEDGRCKSVSNPSAEVCDVCGCTDDTECDCEIVEVSGDYCQTDDDCPSCGLCYDNICTLIAECEIDAHCTLERPRCYQDLCICVECLGDSDCLQAEICEENECIAQSPLTCAEVLDCASLCPEGNLGCYQDCLDQGGSEAQELAMVVFRCAMANDCFNEACLIQVCMPEVESCLNGNPG